MRCKAAAALIALLAAAPVAGCGALPGTTAARDKADDCSLYPTIAQYELPWAAGEHHVLVEGNCGANLHQGLARYAYDFAMPLGSSVMAARAGDVVAVSVASADGSQAGDNTVRIRHQDGSFATYSHLAQNGAKAAVGDYVTAGQQIAVSGGTGFLSQPMLGFAVSLVIDGADTTIPVSFSNSGSAVSPLVEGTSYPLP